MIEDFHIQSSFINVSSFKDEWILHVIVETLRAIEIGVLFDL